MSAADSTVTFPATLFDFNGVLVDDELVHFEAFQDSVRDLEISISKQEYFDDLLGFDDAGAFEFLLKKAGLPVSAQEIERLIEAKRPHYMNRAKKGLATFDGAARLITERAQVGPVAIVSGALRDEIEYGLEVLGVRKLVGAIISAEDTKVSKPDPEGYQLGMRWLDEMGAPAKQALVIEDSIDGIVSAKAVGLTCVAVAQSYSVEKLRSSDADLVVDCVADISAEQLSELYRALYG